MTGRMVNISKKWGFHGVEALKNASPLYKITMAMFALLALAGAAVGLQAMITGYHHV